MAANLPAVRDPFSKSPNVPKVTDPFAPGAGLKSAGGAAGSNNVGKVPQLTGGPVKINKAPTATNSSPPGTPAPQPVAAPPASVGNPTADAMNGIAPPGLTPDQTAAFNTAYNNYQGSLNTDNANLAQAPITEAATIANDKAAYVANSETAQAAAASRGLFNSSIKDGALNDIAATQANNDFVAAGQLSSLTTAINQDISRLNNNWGATATGAVGDAVINAQNVAPTVATPAPTPAAAAASYYAGETPAQQATIAGRASSTRTNLGGTGVGPSPSNTSVAKQKATSTIAQRSSSTRKNL